MVERPDLDNADAQWWYTDRITNNFVDIVLTAAPYQEYIGSGGRGARQRSADISSPSRSSSRSSPRWRTGEREAPESSKQFADSDRITAVAAASEPAPRPSLFFPRILAISMTRPAAELKLAARARRASRLSVWQHDSGGISIAEEHRLSYCCTPWACTGCFYALLLYWPLFI